LVTFYATVNNLGDITGGAGGVGGVNNPPAIGGAGGTGGQGIDLTAGAYVVNSGQIHGGTGGRGGNFTRPYYYGGEGGVGGAAVSVAGPAYLLNKGTIAGGLGGEVGTVYFTYYGGTGGVGVSLSSASARIENTRLIEGGQGAAGLNAPNVGGGGGQGGAAVVLVQGDRLTNAGTVIGGGGGVGGAGGYGGVGGAGGEGATCLGAATLINSGRIAGGLGGLAGTGRYYDPAGYGGTGLALSGYLGDSGTVVGGAGGAGRSNTGSTTGLGGAGGDGGIGITLVGDGTIANSGLIAGGAGGAGGASYRGGAGGAGGAAVIMGAAGVLDNTGTIAGGAGGAGGVGGPGTGGKNGPNGPAGMAGGGVTLLAGGLVINGAAGATNALITGRTGVYAVAAGAVTVNNYGTVQGTGGVSISFHSSADRLMCETGSTFLGVVQGGGGLLELAGGSGTITNIGAAATVTGSAALSFSAFGAYRFDAGGAWALAGTTVLAAGQTVTNFATLNGRLSLASAKSRLIMEGGAKITGPVTASGGALELAGGSGTITGLGGTGTLSGTDVLTFSGFTAYTLDAAADWALTGSSTLTSGKTLTVGGTLVDYGTIVSTAGDGVVLTGAGAAQTGGTTASIVGQIGVYAGVGTQATVTNAGTIRGSTGVAVELKSTADRLILDAGSTLQGAVHGGGGTLEFGAGAGTIAGLGATLTGFASYVVDHSGVWSATGLVKVSSTQNLINRGSFTILSSLVNNGVVEGGAGGVGAAGATAVSVAGKAAVSNGDSIAGGAGGGALSSGVGGAGGAAVYLTGAGVVANTASISGGAGGYGYSSTTGNGMTGGAGGDGVEMKGAGEVISPGAVTGGAGGVGGASLATHGGGDGGAGGEGGAAIAFLGGGTLIHNSGLIQGGAGGAGGSGSVRAGAAGVGGDGVFLAAGGSVSNNGGTIRGGGSAGVQGDGVAFFGAGVITNAVSAAIIGQVGVYGGAGGAVRVTNYGTIDGVSGVALHLASTADLLVVESGSALIGAAIGGGAAVQWGTGSGTITGLGTSFSGFGAYTVNVGGAWTLAGANTVVAGATLVARGALSVGGAIDNIGTIEALVTGVLSLQPGTLKGGGEILAAAGGRVNIDAVDVLGGTIATIGTGKIELLGTATVLNGISSAIDMGTQLVIPDTGGLTIEGVIGGSGGFTMAGSTAATLLTVGAAGATLSTGGSVSLGDSLDDEVVGASASATLTNLNDTIVGGGLLGGGNMTFVNRSTGKVLGTGSVGLTINTGSKAIMNAGLIEADGQAVTILSTIVNTGTLVAMLATLTLGQAVTATGVAQINAGTIIAQAGFDENVTFYGGAGELVLAHSRTYAATISGFSGVGGTSLDLRDIGFVSAGEATYSGTTKGGVLTVSDGAHSATITLSGNFMTAKWRASSDGAGGVVVVAAAGAPSGPGFVAAMASFADAGGSVAAPIEHRANPPALPLARPGS